MLKEKFFRTLFLSKQIINSHFSFRKLRIMEGSLRTRKSQSFKRISIGDGSSGELQGEILCQIWFFCAEIAE